MALKKHLDLKITDSRANRAAYAVPHRAGEAPENAHAIEAVYAPTLAALEQAREALCEVPLSRVDPDCIRRIDAALAAIDALDS